MEPLEDEELDSLLREWKSPAAPIAMRARVFAGRQKHWFWTMCTTSVRVPVPVAFAIAVLLLLSAWRSLPQGSPPEQRVSVQLQSRESATKLRPVTELKPRIIRSRDANY